LSVAAGLLVSAGATAAHAASVNIVAVGSDTIQNVDDVLLSGPGVFNIHAAPTSPQTVPADTTSCQQSVTYAAPPVPGGDVLAPNGSGNGRNALVQGSAYNPAAPNNGCVSIARSSGAPRGTAGGDSAGFEYYAFALDSVSWSSASLNAPAVLTPAQILGIYNCTFTNWAQVGGGSAPIQRFEPQPGSGTRSFFESAFLGGLDPTTITAAGCPAVITVQSNGLPLEENTGKEVNPLFYQTAIIPHSGGQWGFQGNNSINPTVDFRNGFRLGGIVATRKAANNTSITDGATTTGSTTVTSPGNNFTAAMDGAPISGSGIPSGDLINFNTTGNITLSSSGNTRTITDGVTNKTITCINTTAGSKNITINTSGGSCPAVPPVQFTAGAEPAGDVGATTTVGTGNGVGIPDGDKIDTVTDGTHAVLHTAATSTNNGAVVGVNAIKLYLDGGQQTVSSATAAFVQGDVGKIISGANLAAATAITGISGDGKTAFLSKAATGINTSGNTWVIDDPAATATGSALTLSIGQSITSNGSPTLTTTNGAFTTFDVGATVTGGGIPAGTTILSVAGNTATMSANANATTTSSLAITDLSENDVHWDALDGIWIPNTPTSGDTRGPVAENNISLNSSNPTFAGVRYVFHVLDFANPYHTQAQNLVGFTNGPGGSIPSTSICSGSKASTISSFGFASLDTSNPNGTASTGPNQSGSNCRKYGPSGAPLGG
jgi:hypothetical protein